MENIKYGNNYTGNVSVECKHKADSFTTSTKNGNGVLSYPIGLITADEIVFAGSGEIDGNSSDFYLYSGNYFWTMTPDNWSDSDILIYEFSDDALLYSIDAFGDAADIRPVVNLRADLLFTGAGDIESPYKVAGFE